MDTMTKEASAYSTTNTCLFCGNDGTSYYREFLSNEHWVQCDCCGTRVVFDTTLSDIEALALYNKPVTQHGTVSAR